MRALLALMAVLTCGDLCAQSAEADFERLKQFAGEWVKQNGESPDFVVGWTPTAGGTVMVEEWRHRGQSHSLTLYHLDGDRLLATHYCPQGNQPRLQLEPSEERNTLTFNFRDATNLTDPAGDHQHALHYTIVDDATLIRGETYRHKGIDTPSSMTLIRRSTSQ